MSDARHAKTTSNSTRQSIDQSINQSIRKKTKNKAKNKESVFTPASVRLSKNTTGEKGCDRQSVKAWTNDKSTVEEAEKN